MKQAVNRTLFQQGFATVHELQLRAVAFQESYERTITNIQLLQMAVGVSCCVHSLSRCNTHPTSNWLGLAMYFSYFVLFADFWLKRYAGKKAKAPAADKVATTSPPSPAAAVVALANSTQERLLVDAASFSSRPSSS